MALSWMDWEPCVIFGGALWPTVPFFAVGKWTVNKITAPTPRTKEALKKAEEEKAFKEALKSLPPEDRKMIEGVMCK